MKVNLYIYLVRRNNVHMVIHFQIKLMWPCILAKYTKSQTWRGSSLPRNKVKLTKYTKSQILAKHDIRI